MSQHQTFSIEIPIGDETAMKEFQETMESHQEATNKYIGELAKELDVSEDIASDVHYLRSRSRHTPELEKHLISLRKSGAMIKLVSWPLEEDDYVGCERGVSEAEPDSLDHFDAFPQMTDMIVTIEEKWDELPDGVKCEFTQDGNDYTIITPIKGGGFAKYTFYPW
jgi:hypothetical protein